MEQSFVDFVEVQGFKWLTEFEEDPTIIQRFGIKSLNKRLATARTCLMFIEEQTTKERFTLFSKALQKHIRFLIKEGYKVDSDQPYQGSRRYQPNWFYRFVTYIFSPCLNQPEDSVQEEEESITMKMILQHPNVTNNLPKRPIMIGKILQQPSDESTLSHWNYEREL